MDDRVFNAVCFGDDPSLIYPFLRALQQRKGRNVIIDSFLANSCTALRQELRVQPNSKAEEKLIPRYDSVFDLAECLQRENIRNPVLESAILCIAQIASFMSYFQTRPQDYLGFDGTCVLGQGFGMLPAAAIASCQGLADLSSVAPDIVRIVVRIARLATSTSRRLQPSSDAAPWSITVFNVTESVLKNALVEYYQIRHVPPLSQVFISGVSEDAVIISGPPLGLKQLLQECDYLKSRESAPDMIHCLFHAPHLYESRDVEEILHGIVLPTFNCRCRPLFSSATGIAIPASNLHFALEQAICDVLIRPFNWNSVLDGVLKQVAESGRQQCQLLSFGDSHSSGALIKTLQTKLGLEVNLEDLTLSRSDRPGKTNSADYNGADKIAIIGVAGRFPGATDLEGLWQVLEEGRDMHQTIPNSRFNVETHVDPSGKRANTSYTPFGCFIEEPGLFDNRFFNMSPRESAQTDPMHRLALVTACEALEMAGFVPNSTPSTMLERIGTFYGQTSDDWREINGAQKIGTYFIPGGVRAFAPGRINYFFKFSGPSYSIDTACSSGLAAIQVACSSLLRRECDMALSGGLNILTNPDIYAGLSRGQFLSKTGSCKVFDAEADGYCRADAIGSVVLKRLEDAEADNDMILGIVLNSATNHSADAVSITHPHAKSQASLYQSVLNSAGVDALDVNYVEMHGTGTQAGDYVEMQSVTDVFAPKSRQRSMPLYLGSVKANVGHSEAAAGVTALFKLLLMLQKNTIPRHIGIKTVLNPRLPENLHSRNVHIPFDAVPWRSDKNRLAFLNNFSAAGGNTALLLEEHHSRARPPNADPRSAHVLCVSAKSPVSLKRNVEKLINYARRNRPVSLPSLAYTLCARRIHYNYRIAAVVSHVDEIESQLLSALAEPLIPVTSTPAKIVFVFTGQGAFYIPLGRKLFETSSTFRNTLLHLNSIAEKQCSISILPVIEGRKFDADEVDNSPVVSQVAQVCVQIALVELWSSWNIKPDAVVGHSLGEYAALNAAGVLSTSDTIYLVGKRAKLLQQWCTPGTHAMLAVRSMPSVLEEFRAGIPYEIACINGKEDTVLSGSMESIGKLSDTLKNSGIKCIRLETTYAFHSSQMDSTLDTFEEIAAGINFQSPKIPILSPLLSRNITQAGIISPQYLRRHMREPVNFLGALISAENDKIIDSGTTYVEIGPHPICSAMIRSILRTEKVMYSMHKKEDAWLVLSRSLASLYLLGCGVSWNKVHGDFESAHELLKLPSYSFDERNYWIDYLGDWCLTKGEQQILPLPTVTQEEEEVVPLWKRKSKISTSSVHCIVEEIIENGQAKVVVQTDISESFINSLLHGHMVNGNAVCPSSIYADMALTVADYLYKKLNPASQASGMDVCHMKVMKPLIANEDHDAPQILQLSAVLPINSNRAELSFAGIDSTGKDTLEYAKCIVEYNDAAFWLSEWASIGFFVQERVLSLKKAETEGLIPKITRGLAYKLLAVTVDYDARFRGMDIVILDGPKFEAAANVSFQSNEGNFFCNPIWIDSLCQVSGFVLYASDAIDTRNFSFINHGWKYMRFAKSFVANTKYRSYVRMVPAPGNIYEGNVYVFDEEDVIVGVFGGLQFQRLPKAVLDQVIPSRSQGARKTLTKSQQSNSAGTMASVAKPLVSKIRTQPGLFSEQPASGQLAPKEVVLEQSSLSQATVSESEPLIAHITKVIAENASLDTAELKDEVVFSDLGIDSLLSLTIVGQLREELDLDIPGSLFLDYPTMKSLKSYLAQLGEAEDVASQNDSSTASSISFPISPTTSLGSEKSITPAPSADIDPSQFLAVIRSTIANETGVSVGEIASSVDFSSLGMDPYISFTVLGRLREECGLDLPMDFFSVHPSIEKVEKFLDLVLKPRSEPTEVAINPSSYPPAKSILIQGNRSIATTTLFLFPDGSGSAASYASIPHISPDLTVYALDCPFRTKPEDWNIGIPGVVTLYLAEIRRRQPSGPYMLGGWSAGGILAYEATQQLLAAGETVSRLIILDAPAPVDFIALPPRLFHWLAEIGLLGDHSNKSKTPSWVLPHFEACIRNLTTYDVKPVVANQERVPKIFAIWARNGVCGEEGSPKPDFPTDYPPHLVWLLENRTDFGAYDWDTLVGSRDKVQTAVVDSNHFTMLRDPVVKELGTLIRRGIEW